MTPTSSHSTAPTRPPARSASLRAFALAASAATLLALMPTAAAASVDKYYEANFPVNVLSPSAGENLHLHSSCPVGLPTACARIHGMFGLWWVEYQFTVTGHEPGIGVDWVLVQVNSDDGSAACDFFIRDASGTQYGPRWGGSCDTYYQINGHLPAGTYTLHVQCHCGSNGATTLRTINVETGYHGWSVNFEWETSHGLVPPRAESAQPRVCFEFWVTENVGGEWYQWVDVTIDLGDGTVIEYRSDLWEWYDTCHVYAIPVGPAVVCISAVDGLGRSAQECKAVDRGISVS